MTLLTADQLDTATEDELLDLRRAINERLTVIDEINLLAVTRFTLPRLGLQSGTRLTVGVDEWDDGYFWSGVLNVQDVAGTEMVVDDETLAALDAALDEPLANLAYDNRSVGRFDQLVIDLVNNTIYT